MPEMSQMPQGIYKPLNPLLRQESVQSSQINQSTSPPELPPKPTEYKPEPIPEPRASSVQGPSISNHRLTNPVPLERKQPTSRPKPPERPTPARTSTPQRPSISAQGSTTRPQPQSLSGFKFKGRALISSIARSLFGSKPDTRNHHMSMVGTYGPNKKPMKLDISSLDIGDARAERPNEHMDINAYLQHRRNHPSKRGLSPRAYVGGNLASFNEIMDAGNLSITNAKSNFDTLAGKNVVSR